MLLKEGFFCKKRIETELTLLAQHVLGWFEIRDWGAGGAETFFV
jgi:hypothetical protein